MESPNAKCRFIFYLKGNVAKFEPAFAFLIGPLLVLAKSAFLSFVRKMCHRDFEIANFHDRRRERERGGDIKMGVSSVNSDRTFP